MAALFPAGPTDNPPAPPPFPPAPPPEPSVAVPADVDPPAVIVVPILPVVTAVLAAPFPTNPPNPPFANKVPAVLNQVPCPVVPLAAKVPEVDGAINKL